MSEEREICPRCGYECDPEWCWCGSRTDQHGAGDGHSPIPMGCRCGYNPPRVNPDKPKLEESA